MAHHTFRWRFDRHSRANFRITTLPALIAVIILICPARLRTSVGFRKSQVEQYFNVSRFIDQQEWASFATPLTSIVAIVIVLVVAAGYPQCCYMHWLLSCLLLLRETLTNATLGSLQLLSLLLCTCCCCSD